MSKNNKEFSELIYNLMKEKGVKGLVYEKSLKRPDFYTITFPYSNTEILIDINKERNRFVVEQREYTIKGMRVLYYNALNLNNVEDRILKELNLEESIRETIKENS